MNKRKKQPPRSPHHRRKLAACPLTTLSTVNMEIPMRTSTPIMVKSYEFNSMHKFSVSSYIFVSKHHMVIWMEAKSKKRSRMSSEVTTQNGPQNCAMAKLHSSRSETHPEEITLPPPPLPTTLTREEKPKRTFLKLFRNVRESFEIKRSLCFIVSLIANSGSQVFFYNTGIIKVRTSYSGWES